MSFEPVKPTLEFIFRARVTVASPREFGETPMGMRRIIDITGGTVEGPALNGTVIPGGADWQIVRRDGTAVLEARYSIRTDDDALVYIRNDGYRCGPPEVMAQLAAGEPVDPSEYYFRAAPSFETSSLKYAWMNTTLAMSSGVREENTVILDFYAVR